MEQPIKHRPKSAPVITNAYVQNKREDESLCERLDNLRYQQCASLIKLKQTKGDVLRQRRSLLTQRAITPQSSLDHVMDEIHTYKKDKNRPGLARSQLPDSTELHVHGISSKWPPPSSCLPRIADISYLQREGKKKEEASDRRFTVIDDTKVKPIEHMIKHEREMTVMPAGQGKYQRDKEVLTYKQLTQIACLENISTREAERRRQQKKMEKQQLSRSMDSNLQERVHRFLQKLE
ncbi:uncharacterized protein LOC130361405 isoform X1 [Hyla sarda]|uniref:uncharacterized protein LOC130361405 isoform X1 n=1 Tax=Hyla sarda TaxID=327740 RepID=UPI0024C41144|nr:uncharacterized protein LOC130361405 isoform X1 [Hyla sarda]XP_056420333.1 uncharacterized protein LOC130361405 isoform X1 [Hyla sarda]